MEAVDAVRGLVTVLMALDQDRDFVQSEPYRATDLTWTTPEDYREKLEARIRATIGLAPGTEASPIFPSRPAG